MFPRLPGIPDPGRVALQVGAAGKLGRRLVPGRQDDAMGLHAASVREVNRRAFVVRYDVDRVALDEIRAGWDRLHRRLQMLLHEAAQIIPVDHARDESLPQLDLRHRVVLRPAPQPLQKVVRQVGKGGHVSRRHVEQVLHPPRAVGDAAPHGSMLVDDGKVQRLPAETRQVDRGHDPAETPADDHDLFGLKRGRIGVAHIKLRLGKKVNEAGAKSIKRVTPTGFEPVLPIRSPFGGKSLWLET
jgi:hypothetical protein